MSGGSPTAVDHQIYGLPWAPSCSFGQNGFSCNARESIKLLLTLLRAAFPTFSTAIVDHAATDNMIFGRASTTGTFTGTATTVGGSHITPTNQSFSIEIHDQFRFERLSDYQLSRGQTQRSAVTLTPDLRPAWTSRRTASSRW